MSEWRVVQLERTLPDDVVTTVHWTVSKTEDNVSASSYGSLGLPSKDPEDPSFVEFDELTEQEVIAWVHEVMGEEQLEAIESALSAQIDAQNHPKSATGVPW